MVKSTKVADHWHARNFLLCTEAKQIEATAQKWVDLPDKRESRSLDCLIALSDLGCFTLLVHFPPWSFLPFPLPFFPSLSRFLFFLGGSVSTMQVYSSWSRGLSFKSADL